MAAWGPVEPGYGWRRAVHANIVAAVPAGRAIPESAYGSPRRAPAACRPNGVPMLSAGQMSLHDVYLLHGSEANTSPRSRRGMTMRFMPTTSLFDRELARSKAERMKITDHAQRAVFLLRGGDVCGRNAFTPLPTAVRPGTV
ncbi:MAG: phytanoyl-CoA dioxygenase family protein [Burkholderiaceae bacterium]